MKGTCICSFNVEWFFQPQRMPFGLVVAPTKLKVQRLAAKISSLKPIPSILALQEVGGEAELVELCEELKGVYEWRLGRYSSQRTMQRVALLYRPAEVELLAWGSSLWNQNPPPEQVDVVHSDDDHVVAPPLAQHLSVSPQGAFPAVCEKNIWARLRRIHDGVQLSVLNVHLKASWDDPSVAIRTQETLMIQALISQLFHRFPLDQLIVCGDFNDLDTSLDLPVPPKVKTRVLELIKSGESCRPGSRYPPLSNACEKLPVLERVSNIYGDLIDHVLYANCKLLECNISRDENVPKELDQRTSDHFPVLAVFN